MAKKVTKKHLKNCTQVHHHQSMRNGSRKKSFDYIDRLIIFTGPLLPIAVFIQAYNVWFTGANEGLPVSTWLLLLVASASMAAYSYHHRTVSLMMIYFPLMIADGLVLAGILLK
jgi:hypothetical protein